MTTIDNYQAAAEDETDAKGLDILGLLRPALLRWKTLLLVAIFGAVLGVSISFLVKPKFTAVSVFLPPQQQQTGNANAGALAALGAVSGLGASGLSARAMPDMYIGMLESATVSDRVIAKFNLMNLWDERYHVRARDKLRKNVMITAGKKDGMMRIEVMDTDPVLAAAIANQYVEELRTFTTALAVTEAQQRRVFFEQLLEKTRDKLAIAQTNLEASGFSVGALNSEPRNAAESYARLRAELTSAEVKLQVQRRSLADSSPEIRTQQEAVNALNAQIAKLEAQGQGQHAASSDYVNRYREFKYQETLFDLFARQYENARVDESREGALIQVIDPATPPELKTSPSRSRFGLVGFLLGLLLGICFFLIWARRTTPEHA